MTAQEPSPAGDVRDNACFGQVVTLIEHNADGNLVFEALLLKVGKHSPPELG